MLTKKITASSGYACVYESNTQFLAKASLLNKNFPFNTKLSDLAAYLFEKVDFFVTFSRRLGVFRFFATRGAAFSFSSMSG